MPKLKRHRPVFREWDLWGNPIDRAARQQKTPGITPLVFEGHNVRMVIRDSEPWWVAVDVCRVLKISNHHHAVHGRPGRPGGGLDDDEKGVTDVTTPSGTQQMTVVSESGLYRLIFKSRTEDSIRFKRWVTHEVIPSIRKTGSYTLPKAQESRVEKTARRLGCDPKTAKARVDQTDANKKMHARMEAEKAIPNHYRANHNATYRGEFDGQEAADLRAVGGWSDSPLNHMEAVPLSINTHSKTLAEQYIAAHKIPLADQPAVFERFAREVTTTGLSILGPNHVLGFRDHPSRGQVIDVLCLQLAAS